MLFLKNGYPEYLIDRIHILKKEKFPTVKTKHLRLVLPDLGNISLQTRTKLQKSIKGVNYRLISKVQKKQQFSLQKPFSSNSYIRWAYKFQCGLCNEFNCGDCVSSFAIRSSEQIGIFTYKQ